MPAEPLPVRARGLWEGLARVPVSFAPVGGVGVVVSPQSGLGPAGWAGVVALGGSAIVTAPTSGTAVTVRDALAMLPVDVLTDADAVRQVLPVAGVLGPAALPYVSLAGLAPCGAGRAGGGATAGRPSGASAAGAVGGP